MQVNTHTFFLKKILKENSAMNACIYAFLGLLQVVKELQSHLLCISLIFPLCLIPMISYFIPWLFFFFFLTCLDIFELCKILLCTGMSVEFITIFHGLTGMCFTNNCKANLLLTETCLTSSSLCCSYRAQFAFILKNELRSNSLANIQLPRRIRYCPKN